ncbi:MAG TPA: M28 family peptidase, partial [Candidatus Acidoferrum sp.]|nr:M28 family peptidase [Candidatus Acidoferrum sp.]
MKSLALLLAIPALLLATDPSPATRRWWSHVQALSGDDLAGRDTGSEGYRKAAAYVVKQFEAAGLRPAGESGSWYQSVPMRSVRLRTDQSEAALVRADGTVRKLEWLRQITVPARAGAPESVDAPLVFDGQGPAGDLTGKILVRLNIPGAGRRGVASATAGALGTLTIDATTGPEPPRWPVAYSVAVTVADAAPAAPAAGIPFRLNPLAAGLLFEGSGHTYSELMELATAGKPLPRFEFPLRLRAHMKFEAAELKSDNVLGVLPGSDPALANEYVVIGAHLDGYGIGEPWNGDKIYNGAFDDAAYVATLIDFA